MPRGGTTLAPTQRIALWDWIEKLKDDEGTFGDFVTQVFAFLGRRGSGKTYGAGKLAEDMLEAGAQIVVIDPVGNWWGLRMGANGKDRGFDIPVLGGEHGDLALVAEGGGAVADMVVDTGTSVILDVTSFRKAERKRFMLAFTEQFYQRKITSRSAVHVFIEEARLFIPQKAFGDHDQRLLGAMEDMVRLGRNYGIGITMIDQRPQSVNKDALNQAEVLAVFQLTGSQERAAIKKWMETAELDLTEQVGMLSQLPPGDCFLWSPQWLRMHTRTRFAPKRTYDSSATPKAGVRTVPDVQVLPLDLGKLEAAMAASVQAAKDNDPKLLKTRVKELEAEIAALKRNDGAAAEAQYRASYERDRDALTGHLRNARQLAAGTQVDLDAVFHATVQAKDVVEKLGTVLETARTGIGGLVHALMSSPYNGLNTLPEVMPMRTGPHRTPELKLATPAYEAKARAAYGDGDGVVPSAVPKGPMRILNELAIRNDQSVQELAVRCMYSLRTTQNYLQDLRARDLVDGTGTINLRPLGRQAAGKPLTHTSAALRSDWLRSLDIGPRRVLERLLVAHPHGRSSDQLAKETGYSLRTTQNYLQDLRGRFLVLRGGTPTANPTLFEDSIPR